MQTRSLLSLSLILMLSIGLAGCSNPLKRSSKPASAAVVNGVLWEASDYQYVKVVKSDIANPANSHPAGVSQADMRTILSSLYVSERIVLKRVENPLFSIGEQQVLSEALSRGLGFAKAGEDVNFVTIGSHPSSLGSSRKTNSGRVFIQNGKLNMIFGIVHETYTKKDKATQQEIDRRTNPLLPGFRTAVSSKMNGKIALDTGLNFHIDPRTGKERNDWLVIDIPVVLAAMRSKEQDAANGNLSPEMREAIARNSQTVRNLKQDVGNLKEMVFDLQAELDALKAGR